MESGDAQWAEAVQRDYREAALTARQRALCDYAAKLTREPASMTATDLNPLREAGLSDGAILDVVEVAAYFNYINRVADSLGIDPEPK